MVSHVFVVTKITWEFLLVSACNMFNAEQHHLQTWENVVGGRAPVHLSASSI